MPKKRKEDPIDPKNLKPEDKMKFEIAAELGLADKVIAVLRPWGGRRTLPRAEQHTCAAQETANHSDKPTIHKEEF